MHTLQHASDDTACPLPVLSAYPCYLRVKLYAAHYLEIIFEICATEIILVKVTIINRAIMEDDDNARTELSGNPQLAHLVFIKMEDLMDGLKLLNYETKFCRQFKFKPFSRYYSI